MACTDDVGPPPVLLALRSSKTFIVSTVIIAVFTDVFLYGLVVPVFPFALHDRASIPPSDVQTWVSVLLGVYGVGLLLGAPLFGWFADHYQNRRLPLLCGLTLLLSATLLIWFGRHISLLIIGRLFQGFATACVWSVATAMLVDTVGSERSGRYMGFVTIAMTGGFVVAPIVGGLVYDNGGYDAVFAMAVSLVAVDILLRLVLIERKTAIQYLATDNEQRPLLEPVEEDTPKDVAVVKTTSPIISLSILLTTPRFLEALLCSFFQAIVLTSMESTLPLHLHLLFDYGASASGLVFIFLLIPSLFAPLIGHLSDKHGARWILTAGCVLSGPSIIALRLPTENTIDDKILLCLCLLFVGVGHSFLTTPALAEISSATEEIERKNPGVFGANGAMAQAYGMSNTAFAAGNVAGPLLAGWLRNEGGWGMMTLSIGLFAGLIAVPAALFAGERDSEYKVKRQANDVEA